ncbi:hypothetical protein C8J56DRAFT_1054042 [Mycena floridula]|nr:hypothetical protein C8J56DRAFT_1054042 [Mycena floridula]
MASLAHLLNPVDQAPTVLPNASRFSHSTPHSSIFYDVRINRQTTLSRMYRFNEPGAYIEYPETGEKPVGYLFHMDPDNWELPTHSFAYSLGSPSGYSEQGKQHNAIHISMLQNSSMQEQVSCSETHYTCRGVKVCPHGDMDKFSAPHTAATRENVASRLANDRDARLMYASPSADIFAKTQAFITALRRGGCRAELQEHTPCLPSEVAIQQQNMAFQHGYQDKVERCKGRAIFQYDDAGKPFISCQHYDPEASRDHLVQYLDGSYDLDYLEAVLEEDTDEIERIEHGAEVLGYGPLVESFDHRTSDGSLEQATMVRMECGVKIQIFQPLEAHRRACPYVLVTVKGVHEHPIPLPLKTPPAVKAIVLDLIDKIGTDLADLMTRHFLRHPVVRAYLQETFPGEVAPNFSQVHVSLANRSHLSSYIDKASKKKFPFGTGWEGVKHLKEIQDHAGNPEAIYVRHIIEVSAAGVVRDIQDEETAAASSQDLRIIVCMTRKQSDRLLKAQYLQGDVTFKCVIGFKEFELASLNRDANTIHSDVNQEGKGCSLLGAIEKGHHFDSMKMATLEALETSGVRPSYNAGHRSENEIQGLKRRFNFRHGTLVSQDKALENHCTKLQTALDQVSIVQQAVEAAQNDLDVSNAAAFEHGLELLQTRQRAHARATAEYQELLEAGKELAKGTGHNQQQASDVFFF